MFNSYDIFALVTKKAMHKFIQALFTVTRKKKQHRCLRIGEQMINSFKSVCLQRGFAGIWSSRRGNGGCMSDKNHVILLV